LDAVIERWFKELTGKPAAPPPVHQRRRTHRGHHHLGRALEHRPEPFIWKATTEDIIAKVQRGREALHQITSTTDH
jgi:hypothetical protein